MTARFGLIVNPLAGLGGRVGLKGSDGAETARLALERGAVPVSPARAERAIVRLVSYRNRLQLLTPARAMGADLACALGFEPEIVEGGEQEETTAADTRAAASAMVERGVQLILYAGGDGTTRDIVNAIGTRAPILGIPTGVKMHSATFATSPEAAGELAARYLTSPTPPPLREAEVMDVDETALRQGHLSFRLYGSALTPTDPLRVQHPKAASPPADAALEALCRQLAEESRGLTIFGPGTTTQRILAHLGIEGTLLGVDAVEEGRLVGRDLSEAELLELLDDRPARLVVGVVGGQGFLFGRGNQQLSPAVIRRVGLQNIEIVASLDKLLALQPPRLRVDTGEPELDRQLAGFRRVRVAPSRYVMLETST